ncbi:MAG: polysaccharide deacetylase family protein [Anaerolineae bacterium]
MPDLVYRQGIPRLLDLFDDYGIRATFFVCGRDLPAHSDAVAEMARRGPRDRQPHLCPPHGLCSSQPNPKAG